MDLDNAQWRKAPTRNQRRCVEWRSSRLGRSPRHQETARRGLQFPELTWRFLTLFAKFLSQVLASGSIWRGAPTTIASDYAASHPSTALGLSLPYLGLVGCRRSQLKTAATPRKIEPL